MIIRMGWILIIRSCLLKKGGDIVLLDFDDIYMIRVENKKTKVCDRTNEYVIKKPLYKMEIH